MRGLASELKPSRGVIQDAEASSFGQLLVVVVTCQLHTRHPMSRTFENRYSTHVLHSRTLLTSSRRGCELLLSARKD